jgi:hypothetical protein
MNKELEALLMTAAKETGYGVVGCDPARAADWGVELAKFTREGEPNPFAPGGGTYATTGYRISTGGKSLGIEGNSPGDGWTRYSLFVYGPHTTGVSHFAGGGVYTLSEMKTLLRGIYYGARTVREGRR